MAKKRRQRPTSQVDWKKVYASLKKCYDSGIVSSAYEDERGRSLGDGNTWVSFKEDD